MLVFAVLCAVAVVLGQTPPRPNIPEAFYAEVRLESHSHDGPAVFGDGRWAIDPKDNKAVEDYQFHVEGHIVPLIQFDLERFDLGQAFSINSYDRHECMERQISGSVPPTWSSPQFFLTFAYELVLPIPLVLCISNATYIGKDIFHSIEIDLWAANFGGVELEVGVRSPDYNIPVIFNRRGPGFEMDIEFARFDGNNVTFDSHIFDIPQECQGQKGQFKVTPPTIASSFYTTFECQGIRNGEHLVGEGDWGSDYTNKKLGEDYMLRDYRSQREIRVYSLQRFDLHEAYEIDSTDHFDCHNHTLNSTMVPPFSWVSQATFKGTSQSRQGPVDVWNFVTGNVNLTLAVSESNTNLPVWFIRGITNEAEEYFEFRTWHDTAPEANFFDVPHDCQQ